jgi:hypothetical protein
MEGRGWCIGHEDNVGMEDVRGQVSESSGGRAGDEGMEVIERSKVGTQTKRRTEADISRLRRGPRGAGY